MTVTALLGPLISFETAGPHLRWHPGVMAAAQSTARRTLVAQETR